MGKPEQLVKRCLAEETLTVTHGGASWSAPTALATGELLPDGMLRSLSASLLSALPSPWCHLEVEVMVELKTWRDHADRGAVSRGVLRRDARRTNVLETLRDDRRKALAGVVVAPDPPEASLGLWFAATRVPVWLREDEASGEVVLRPLGQGVYSLEPSRFQLLWVSANDLPLHESLIPFLVLRSGRPLIQFLAWATKVRGPVWVCEFIKDVPMTTEILQSLQDDQDEAFQEEQRLFKNLLLKTWIEKTPVVYDEIIEKGIEQGIEKGIEKGIEPLTHLFERKLQRPLTAAEHESVMMRLSALGPARLGDVVLDLDATALSQWLTNPKAV